MVLKENQPPAVDVQLEEKSEPLSLQSLHPQHDVVLSPPNVVWKRK